MAKHFLHVSFRFSDDNPKIDELKPIFDKATDWYRYSSTNWVIWTGRSAATWYKMLRPHITDKDTVFIVRMDPSDRQGWVGKGFWDWLKQDRSDDT